MSDTLVAVLSSVWSKLLCRGQPSFLPGPSIFLQTMTEEASKHIVILNHRLSGCWDFFSLYLGEGYKDFALSASWHNDCLLWTTAFHKLEKLDPLGDIDRIPG